MAVTAQEIRQSYPLPVYNYRVEIGGEAIAFSEVSGLTIGNEVSTYKESPTGGGGPGPRVVHMPSQPTAPKITLKKGIVRGQSVATLYKWIASIQLNLVEKRDIFIRLCDEAGAPVISWRVINAFPTKLDAPSFDAKSNDVAVESMELQADRVTIEEA
jgi:phage tail-like protein